MKLTVFIKQLALVVTIVTGCKCTFGSDVASKLNQLGGRGFGTFKALTLADLDVDNNGEVNENDERIFGELEKAAQKLLTPKGLELPVAPNDFYSGPPSRGMVQEFLRPGFWGFSIEPSTRPETLIELVIESRWLRLKTLLAKEASPELPLTTPVFALFRSGLPNFDPDQMSPQAVCAGLSNFDFGPYDRANIKPTAVFDLDGTIWDGNVMDPFLARLIEGRYLSSQANNRLRDVLKTLPDVATDKVDAADVFENARLLLALWTSPKVAEKSRPSAKDVFQITVELMAGLPLDKAQSIAHDVFNTASQGFEPYSEYFFDDETHACPAPRLIEILQKRGVDVYLLSATPDLLAMEAAKILKVPLDHVLGSVLETQNGHYTGRVLASTYSIKGAIARQWLKAPPVFSFGDSPDSDFSMFQETMGVAFMLNPRPAMQARDKNEAFGKIVALWYKKQ